MLKRSSLRTRLKHHQMGWTISIPRFQLHLWVRKCLIPAAFIEYLHVSVNESAKLWFNLIDAEREVFFLFFLFSFYIALHIIWAFYFPAELSEFAVKRSVLFCVLPFFSQLFLIKCICFNEMLHLFRKHRPSDHHFHKRCSLHHKRH